MGILKRLNVLQLVNQLAFYYEISDLDAVE